MIEQVCVMMNPERVDIMGLTEIHDRYNCSEILGGYRQTHKGRKKK